jgi:CBS-domain-containing membrane protein
VTTAAAGGRDAGTSLASHRFWHVADVPCETQAAGRVADAMITCQKTHRPGTRLTDIRAFFEDDHVHMALIVAADGRLLTTIERADLLTAASRSAPVATLGTLTGRTARPADPLSAATATLTREGRRRLAVVDDSGRLLGLLCPKKDGAGYCSDEGIGERARSLSVALT